MYPSPSEVTPLQDQTFEPFGSPVPVPEVDDREIGGPWIIDRTKEYWLEGQS